MAGLLAAAFGLEDPSLRGAAAGIALLLCLPLLLLSLIDLGRWLRLGTVGYRTTATMWLLSHLQAAVGAIAVAVGGLGLFHWSDSWMSATGNFDRVLLIVSVPIALGMIAFGFHYIYTAFSFLKDRSTNDT